MTDDGHDTNVTFTGAWAKKFLTPLLSNKNFLKNTLVLLTFDENETYNISNKVWGALLGDAVPEKLKGTTDSNYYNPCTSLTRCAIQNTANLSGTDSEISTVEANWCLSTLGRWDVGANVYSFVGAKTGDTIRPNPSPYYYNGSYPGIMSATKYAPQPVPNISLIHNGRKVLPAIQAAWKDMQNKTYYTDSVITPDEAHPPPSS